MSKLLEKYDAKIQEKNWQKYWDEQKIYQFRDDKKRDETFVIDTPPPTVSGLLHMGHIFSYTQADIVARYNRMQGKDVFYPMGFDDNGLPTERLVEKIIDKKAMAYEAQEREKNQGGSGYFVAKCREVVKEAEDEFEDLFKSVALSVDWEQKYQTISSESQKISQASFLDLYHKGLIEKQNQPVFWDIADRTALAQADIIDKEIEGEMFFINFTLDGINQDLEIMTTRPELLPACVAVMISTESKIYQETLKNLISQPLAQKLETDGQGLTGLFAITPIFGVKVEIIVDNDSVKADKGTGAVMCCTFGDETDLKWWRKFGLANREIIDSDGSIKNLINVDENLEYKKLFEDYVIISEFNASFLIEKKSILNPKIFIENYQKIANQKIKEAKKIIVELLSNSLIFNSPPEWESKSPSDFGGVLDKNFATRNYKIKNLSIAKELRSNTTDSENILWQEINKNQLGYSFKRQQPIGNYIVDFICFEKKLIIELDGSGHAEKINYDAKQDKFLSDQGFRVLRLWNNEFSENIDGIIDYILELLKNDKIPPHQNRFAILTPPQGESLNPESSPKATTSLQKESLPPKIKSQKITRPVKCAERSGMPIEIISKPQWFIKILDKKEQLKRKSHECNWYPDYMRVRIEQWIDGLSWDWCISRQRFFGVKFPVWNLKSFNPEDSTQVKWGEHSYDPNLANKSITADISQLPVDPEIDIPLGFTLVNKSEIESAKKIFYTDKNYSIIEYDFNQKIVKDSEGKLWFLYPETDIMDTWATSSISPQLSSKGISSEFCFDEARHQKLFPADMRPQAHEIIRTWAFYTIVKAYLHSLEIVKDQNGKPEKNQNGSIKLQENPNSNQTIPWHNLMISGWCLASDKTKMSKSKGNVVTPKNLIEEKSADVVRYWASASNLGADIAYSEEVFKIGQKLITKLFNSAKFCSQHFAVLENYLLQHHKNEIFSDENLSNLISHPSDLWILSRLEIVINEYNKQFAIYEYAKAREVLEEFFWHYFCDNYLEICKVRSYGLQAQKLDGIELSTNQTQEILLEQLSSLATLSIILKNILKLFAPFIPFICEEIYSEIFSDEFRNLKSIHNRGNKAKLPAKFQKSNVEILKIGDEILKILFEVRKYKSEKNQSMKTEIELLEISSELDLSCVKNDIANVCNAKQIMVSKGNTLIKIS